MRYEDASQNIAAATSDSATVARPDVDTLPPGSFGPATGNAISGTGTTTGAAGADSAGAQPAAIVEVTGAGGATSASGGNFQAVGQYGLLSMDTQGNFNYVRNAGTPDGVKDVFGYTLADAAGARSSTTLTIDISQVATAAAGQAVVNLPPGVELSDIKVVGRDLVITMPDGSQMVIPGGAVFVPQLMIGDVQVPASNLAALLVSSEPQPAAGQLQSSGGNFAADVPPLDPGVPLGDLIPPTELDYTPPDFEDVGQFVDEEPEVTIQPDGQPASVAAVDEVFEAGLPTRNGGEPEGSGEEAAAGANGDPREATTGLILFEADDGLASITINGVAITSVGQTFAGAQGTLTITSIDLANGQIGYSYLLTDNTNPGGDGITDPFTVVVTDDDGDTATATLTINIVDDVPTARNDTDAVAAGATSTDGNVMSGAGTTSGSVGKDTVGADNATLTAIASVNVPANTDSSFDASGNLVVQGQFGSLTIKADGSYVYTLSGNQGAGGTEVFRYTLTDGDGDTSTATLTITVPADPVPQPANATAIVDDDGLPAGNKDSAPGDDVVPNTDGDNNEATFSGTLTANFGTDTPGTFTLAAMHNQTAVLGQETVRYTWNDATDTLTAEVIASPDPARIGLDLFTVELNPNGQFDVTLLDNVLQIDDGTNTENNATAVLTFTATDADGDSTNATLTITFDDDIPVAIIPPPPPQGQPPRGLVSGQVDEDALPDGNNDSAPGDDPGGTTASGVAGSLGALFNAGADQPLTFSLSSNTSGLPSLTSNGVPVTYAVVGNVLTASAGGTPVFTLTVNADGSWQFQLLDQLDHPTADTEDNLLLDLSSVVVATDADGDEATAAAGAFVIDVDDDMPVPSDANPITGLVDEDDLPTGNNDDAPGDDDPDNLDGDNDGTTTGGGAPSLATLFNGGADQPLTILLSTDTSGLTAQALTSQGAALSYNVNVDTGVLTGYVESGATAGFQAGEDRTVFTLTVNEDGTWEFDLQDQLDHPVAGTEDNLLIDFSSVITAVDADGDTAELPDDMFVIDVDDDMPQEFEDCPQVISVNESGSSFTGSLMLPPVGADEPGTVTFGVEDGDPVLDTGGDPLTSGGEPLFYFINASGVLEARVGDETGDVVFTITINNNGTFTYNQFLPIDAGGGVSFDDLTSTSAGNVEFRGVGADDPATAVDLLLSAEAGGADATVNTDSDSIGAANQSMDAGETVRIDFVSNLTTDGADPDNPPSGFNYNGHVSSNSFIGLIPQVQGSQSETVAFTVFALNTTNTDAAEPDRDPTGGFSDSTITAITDVTVKDYLTGGTTTVDVTGFTVGVFTPVAYGISVRVNADGSVTFSGIQEGDSYGFNTDSGTFNAVAVQAEPTGTGGSTADSFDLGVFSIGAEQAAEPVDFDVPITFTDFDGDPVVCDIEVRLGPPVAGPDVAVTVNEAGLPIGSDAASDSETATGDLSGTVSGGTGPYTFVLVGSGNGTFGTLTLNPNGTFTYTLDTPFDSSPDANDGTNPELGAESFTYQVTDSTGATSTGTITINIIDDVPTAVNDTDATDPNTDQASGNVITDAAPGDAGDSDAGADTVGADQPGAVTAVASNNVPANSDNTYDGGNNLQVTGQFGSLVINANGSYTYTANPGTPGGSVEVFTYTLTDADGDTSTATLTITVADQVPTLPDPAAVLLDDDALAGGNAGGTGDDVDSSGTPGQLVGSGGDGDLDYNFTGSNTLPAGFTVNTVNAGQIQILQGATVVLTVTLNNDTGSYTVVQNNPIDHPAGSDENNLSFLIGVEVEDADGDTEPATITINVDDDTPVAANDTDTIASGSVGPATGNVITDAAAGDAGDSDTGADSVGADTPGSITGIASNNVPANTDTTADGSGNFVVAGQYGTLTINQDGSYSYARNPGQGAGQNDVFTYTLTDGDGDSTTATLTISIGDATPTLPDPAAVLLDDDALAGGNAGGTGDDVDSSGTPGQLVGSGGDGDLDYFFTGSNTLPAGFTVNTVNAGQIQILQGATVVLTVTLDNETGSYTVVQNNPIDHPAGSDENNLSFSIGVQVQDVDGDTEPATITINVDDDTPVAANDTDTIASGSLGPATGNVITDAAAGDAGDTDTGADSVGADTPGSVTAIASNNVPANVDTTADGSGNFVVAGQYGTLTINQDGSYSYARTAGTPGGVNDVFTYTLTDGDGDSTTATLTISIGDATPGLNAPATAQLDDDDVAGTVGNPGGTGDDALANTSGTLVGTGGDGDLDYFFSGTNTLPSGFTVNQVNASTLQILQGATVVLTVTLTNESGDYTVVQNNPIIHPTGSDENNLTFNIGVLSQDVDGDQSPSVNLTINVDDDSPINFTPQDMTDDTNATPANPEDDAIVNDGTGLETNPIHDTNNDGVGENFIGADGFGSLTFTTTGHTDGELARDAGGTALTSGGKAVYLVGFGTDTLTAYIDSGATVGYQPAQDTAVAFTVTLNEGTGYGANSTYTIDFNAVIDNGAGVTFSNLTSTKAGNVDVRGVGADNAPTTVDLLLTASGPGGVNATINTDSDSVGSGNQSMDEGETVRIDLVSNLQDDPADDLSTFPSGFSYDGHVSTNSLIQTIPQVQGSQSETVAFRVYALNTTVTDADLPDDYPGDGFSDSSIVTITKVTIDGYNDGPADGTPDEPAVTVDISGVAVGVWTAVAYGVFVQKQADGSVIFTGVQEGDKYGIETGTSFNAFAVTSLPAGVGPNAANDSSTNSFDLGVFAIGSVVTGDPIDLSFGVTATDADGDTSTGTIDVTLAPVPTTTTTTTLSTSSLSTQDVSSTLLVANDNHNNHKAFKAGNDAALMGVVAAAGLSALHSGAGDYQVASIGQQSLNFATLQGQPVTSVSIEPQTFALPGQELALAANFQSQQVIEQSLQVRDVAMHIQSMAPEQLNAPAMTELLQGTVMATHGQTVDLASQVAAMAVAMPSAEQLAAVSGPALDPQSQVAGLQHNEVVGKVLADALNGGGQGPNLEAVLNALPGNVEASLDALASHGAAAVSIGHMANFAGFSSSHGAFTMDPMVIQQDAAPAHV